MKRKKKKSSRLLLIMFLFFVVGMGLGVWSGLKEEYPDLTLPVVNQYEGDPKSPSENGSPYKFYYETLESIEKQAYNCILDEIYDMPEKILVPDLTETELENVFSALLKDNPDLFFIGRHCSTQSELWCNYFTVEYSMEKSEYESKKAELEAICDNVVSSVTDKTDTAQVELKIHDYIVNNCTYQENDDNYVNSSSYGCLLNKAASCEGYSKATKLLLDKLGVENYVVSGTSINYGNQQGAHMWNVVKVNDAFYHLDVTWDDPVTKSKSGIQLYSYFNLSDEYISENHTDYDKVRECNSMAENYYVKRGLWFDSYNSDVLYDIGNVISKEYSSGSRQIQIRFTDGTVYSKAHEALIENREIVSVLRKYRASNGNTLADALECYMESADIYTITFIF